MEIREMSRIDQEIEAELCRLMSAYQAGSLEAFQAMYSLLAPSLSRYLQQLARTNDASDLLQEAFLQIHRSRGAYNSVHSVRPWVFGVARNVFLMHRRSSRRWADVHDMNSEPPEVAVPPEVETLGSAEEIRHAVAGLKPERAEALLLHHEWGFSFREIAGMLGISAEAARARASRGIADLRQILTETKGRRR